MGGKKRKQQHAPPAAEQHYRKSRRRQSRAKRTHAVDEGFTQSDEDYAEEEAAAEASATGRKQARHTSSGGGGGGNIQQSNSVKISNLKRPWKQAALADLLQTCGFLALPLFVDSIKTVAIATFEKGAAAATAKASLHGIVWPPTGAHALAVDFFPLSAAEVTEETAKQATSPSGGGAGLPPPGKGAAAAAAAAPAAKAAPKGAAKASKDVPIRVVITRTDRQQLSGDPARVPLPPRQQQQQQSAAPSASATPETGALPPTLDEVFCRTTAEPSLYFLPVEAATAARRRDSIPAELAMLAQQRLRGEGGAGAGPDAADGGRPAGGGWSGVGEEEPSAGVATAGRGLAAGGTGRGAPPAAAMSHSAGEPPTQPLWTRENNPPPRLTAAAPERWPARAPLPAQYQPQLQGRMPYWGGPPPPAMQQPPQGWQPTAAAGFGDNPTAGGPAGGGWQPHPGLARWEGPPGPGYGFTAGGWSGPSRPPR